MILRLVAGRVPIEAAAEFSARLAGDVLDRTPELDGLLATSFGIRGEVDHWAFLAVSVWRDRSSIEAATGGQPGPTRAFATLAGAVTFDDPLEYEIPAEPVSLGWDPAVMGIVRVRVSAAFEQAVETLVRHQQQDLVASGDVRALLVGRRPVDDAAEIAAVAVWKDRDRMRTFITERPEGPGIDPRFIELTADFRFETYDVVDPREPLPAPAVPAVLVLDVGRIVVDASTGVEQLLGMPAEMVLGRRLDDVVARGTATDLDGQWRAFLRSGRQAGSFVFVRPAGPPVSVRYVARANLPDPGLHAWLLVSPEAPAVVDPAGVIRSALDTRARSDPRSASRAAAAPTIVCVPSRDTLFQRFVVETQRALGTPSARRLQLHLRGLYPHAVVHRRELEREPASTWYVFRDRSLGLGLPDRWWEEPGVASASVDADGRLVAVDETASALHGDPPDRLLGRDVRALGIPGSFDDFARLLRVAFEEGTVDSTIRLLDREGRPVDLAFHGEVAGGTIRFAATRLREQGEPAEWYAPICLPTNDELFISRVEELCARLAPGNAGVRAAQLANRLHAFYPNAIVRSLGHVVGFGPGTHVLLVYRDGHRSPFADRPWWEDPTTAVATLEHGRYIDANDAALALYGLSLEQLLATKPGELVVDPPDAIWLADILNRTGVLHSIARVRRPDGVVGELEYRVTRDPLDPDRLIAAVRPVTAADAPAPSTSREVEPSPAAPLAGVETPDQRGQGRGELIA